MKEKTFSCFSIAVASICGVIAAMNASSQGQVVTKRGDADQPLRVDKQGRYFETANGHPWFWLGDTGWPLMAGYTPDEAKTYLEARAKTGFTVIQIVAIWDGGTGTEKGINPNPNTAGEQPWIDKDPLKPNEAYWKNVDRVITVARENGLYVALLPVWGSHVVNTKMVNASNAKAYGEWLGRRYKYVPNIVWVNGGDRKVTDAPEVWNLLAEGLAAGDAGIHPITFHPGMDRRATSSSLHHEPWLAANMIQTWANFTDIPECIAADYKLTPPKPVILAEGAYEEGPEYPTKPITPLIVRKQAWWAYLSGGSFTYGHNDSWRKPATWSGLLKSEGAKNMGVLRAVFAGLDWWNLVPDQDLFASGKGSDATLNVAARSKERTWAMIYFASAATAELKPGLLESKQGHATWVNPKTGEHTDAGNFDGAAKHSFHTPDAWEDAVLLLQPAR